MKPLIFISSVSRELRTARQLVANTLHALGYEPVWQDIFETSPDDLREMLRKKIDSCSAVLQIVGHAYGAEPPTPDATFGRCSYTQYEALYARSRKKPVYYLIAEDDLPRDAAAKTIDTPRDESDSAQANAAERLRLQSVYRQGVLTAEQVYYPVHNHQETELSVRRLRNDLAKLRRGFRYWMIAITTALVLIASGIAWLNWRQQKAGEQIVQTGKNTVAEIQKLYADPDVLIGTLKSHVRKRAAEEISKARMNKADWRKIDEIEKRRDQALDRVEDLVKTIRDGLTGDADPVFVEAARLLAEKGVQEALEYLESKQPETLNEVDRIIDRQKQDEEKKRDLLKRFLLEANLRKTDLQWEKAVKLYEIVVIKAPTWFDARVSLGSLSLVLARFEVARAQLDEAVKLAGSPKEEAWALSELAALLQETNRLAEAEPLMRRSLAIFEQSYGAEHTNVATRLNNLATLLKQTNRPVEAERLMRRSLAIDELSHGPDHAWGATPLNNLAALLHETNRLTEAEPLMRRALAIGERSYGIEHPSVAINLNNLAQLLKDTSRLAEAEPLMRRALAIDEHAYGAEHTRVARDLSNLTQLLQDTNRQVEAEPLMCRALAIEEQAYGAGHPSTSIVLSNLGYLLRESNRRTEAELLLRRALAVDEQSFGVEHPQVATRLNNLAALLMATNHLAEAEPLLRRALAIFEQSYGAEHPRAATGLNNLGQILQATNHLNEAESLMHRCRIIIYRFQVKTGHTHPSMKTYTDKYRKLLEALKLSPAEIDQRLKEAESTTGPLNPITPEIERMLGPAKSVADVLAARVQRDKADGKPAVYFLSTKDPITPHLSKFLQPNPSSLLAAGIDASFKGDYANAIAYYEASLKYSEDRPDSVATAFMTRMIHAAALRELGELESARDELKMLLAGLNEGGPITALSKGRARYHLALCEWRLNDREAAQREAEESLKEYGDNLESAHVKKQSEQLLADLKENKPLPPLAEVDAVAALEQARARFRARAELATLPLNQSALPLLDQMLGPAKSTKEVIEELDRQYREQNKPPVWFLPLSEPISPHLDELLGPVPAEKAP